MPPKYFLFNKKKIENLGLTWNAKTFSRGKYGKQKKVLTIPSGLFNYSDVLITSSLPQQLL